jgi:hypothetical protein
MIANLQNPHTATVDHRVVNPQLVLFIRATREDSNESEIKSIREQLSQIAGVDHISIVHQKSPEPQDSCTRSSHISPVVTIIQ